ncbi:MAG: Na+/H+ antiporter NhaA [Geodermatophilaceae bacterium]|nr:Na+/H+ antiporter NhaA [Geodermatophilaceae bacterium]MDQ3465043.1 Na+/H+ antiporter NhaA [Actinomycetota bacterium]
MLSAAVIALIWVNSPLSESYVAVRDAEIGPQSLNLHLSLGTWAADGLLAVFFFVAGLELKRELVVGELRSIKSAMLPVFAAIGGIVVPAGLAALIMFGAPGAGQAWAIPVATDIAFALAVLAIAARALPRSVRLFLLSLAVVDDLGAIILIAVLFTTSLSVFALLGAAALLGSYALLQHYRIRTAWLYVPITVGTWIAVHESGVHATVAGVALALLTRVRPDEGEDEAPAVRLEHRLQPLSAGFCVPVFAFFAAGVVVSGAALGGVFTDRVALGVVVGLLAGKFLGVFGGAALAVRLRLATLNDELRWRDIAAVAVLGGVGFTVSLLITELAFDDPMVLERVKIGVLIASAVASLIGAGLLKRRASVRSNGP